MRQEINDRFFTDTDSTGRFIVRSTRTGKTYAVEPIGDPHTKWGSIDPASKKLVNKPAFKKYRGSIDAKDSLITEENGFHNIRMLEPGDSPLAVIEQIDAKYPDLVKPL